MLHPSFTVATQTANMEHSNKHDSQGQAETIPHKIRKCFTPCLPVSKSSLKSMATGMTDTCLEDGMSERVPTLKLGCKGVVSDVLLMQSKFRLRLDTCVHLFTSRATPGAYML